MADIQNRNENFKLYLQEKTEKEDDVDSEVEYFQNWIVPTCLSTNFEQLKSTFVVRDLKCDYQRPNKSIFEIDNKSCLNFNANVDKLQNEGADKPNLVDELNVNRFDSHINEDDKYSINNDSISESQVPQINIVQPQMEKSENRQKSEL